jgi:hypothetical protein
VTKLVEHKIIYFDEKVEDAAGNWIGGTWISLNNARRIAEYFEGRGFKRKCSSELGKWMNQVISLQECSSTTLIFAQDVAPYDVFDDISSNALIRQYLDQGGSILWIGDVPFFYVTKWENGHFKRETIPHGAYGVLGVVPVNIIAASNFSITKGYKYGLRSNWASLRPIINPSYLETERTRFWNSLKCQKGFVELAHVDGIGVPWLLPFERKGHLQRFLEFLGMSSFKAGPVEMTSSLKEKLPMEIGMRYSSAWIKVFDMKTEGSGFIRVWDYSPRVISNKMLEEIFVLLNSYCRRKI